MITSGIGLGDSDQFRAGAHGQCIPGLSGVMYPICTVAGGILRPGVGINHVPCRYDEQPRGFPLAFCIGRQTIYGGGPGGWPSSIPIVTCGYRYTEHAKAVWRCDLRSCQGFRRQIAVMPGITSVRTVQR